MLYAGGGDQAFGGAGDDHVFVVEPYADITLGDGRDTVTLGDDSAHVSPGLFIADFHGGPGGDVLDLTAIVADFTNFTPGTDPFADGHLALGGYPDGSAGVDLYVSFDGDPAHEVLLATLGGYGAQTPFPDDLTIDNFIGFDAVGVNRTGLSLTGGFGDDTLTTNGDAHYGGIARGLAGNDLLIGSDGPDVLLGGGGNDTLVGHGGGYADSSPDDQPVRDELDGGAGLDTADYSASSAAVLVDLSVLTRIGYDADTYLAVLGHGGDAEYDALQNIENLTGSAFADNLGGDAGANVLTGLGGDDHLNGRGGADALYGGEGADLLSGGDGNDTLDGGAGADQLQGGTGDDLYVVDSTGDAVFEKAGEGTDTVQTTLSTYTLGANLETLTYTGSAGFTGTGNALANVITGGSGSDLLDGGKGGDTVYGGLGDDTINVDTGLDRVFGGDGTDTVVVSNSDFHLNAGSGVETLVAAGTLGVALYGAEGAEHLIGNAAANLLDGGAGADTLEGGGGNDTYILRDLSQQIVEQANGGYDTVKTALAGYALADNVEALTYTGAGDFSGSGNASNNLITGGAGNDQLDGDVGADTLVGGAGNDTYYVDDVRDVVTELANGGHDQVTTTVGAYTLGANVEDLFYNGVSTFNGAGNGGANTINADLATAATLHGGSGDDTLVGSQGDDSLYGDGGADKLYGGDGNDYVRTLTGEGPDTVDGGFGGTDLLTIERTNLSTAFHIDLSLTGEQMTLGDGGSIMNVEQIRFAGGSGADSVVGGGLDDVLKGNGGTDMLVGGAGNDILQGGTGADSLTGGAGSDTFRFDGPTAGDGNVTDFQTGVDHVALSHTGFGIASLADFDIVDASTGAFEAKATLIVDTVNHTLAWDADGTGAASATLFAHGAFTTSAADYMVF